MAEKSRVARFLSLAAAAGARHRCSSAEPTAPCRGPRLQWAESGHGRLWNGNNLGVTRGPLWPLKRAAAGPEASLDSAELRAGAAAAAECPAASPRSHPTWEQGRSQDGRAGSVSRPGERRVGAGLTCMFFGWRGGFCGSTHGAKCQEHSGKEEEGGVRCGSPSNWHFSGQRSGHSNQRRLPTMAPQNHQDTSLRNPRVPAAACRARPKTTQPQGHAAKDPSAPAKSHAERAPRGRKPPRNRGASRPPPSSAAAPHVELPSEDMSGTELSPRNLPVGVAIAIGPSRKPGSSSSRDCERRSLPTSTQRWCKALSQLLFLAKNQLRPAKAHLRPSKSPKASRCQRLCESSHSACGCA